MTVTRICAVVVRPILCGFQIRFQSLHAALERNQTRRSDGGQDQIQETKAAQTALRTRYETAMQDLLLHMLAAVDGDVRPGQKGGLI